MSPLSRVPSRRIAAGGAADAASIALFLALCGLLAARPMISETFERIELSFLSQANVAAPTPATSVWIDACLLVASAIAFVYLGPRGGGLRLTWAATAILTAMVALSTLGAGEKRLAANAGANLCIAAVAAIALHRLMAAAWMPRALLAAMIASASVNALKCGLQAAYEFADTREAWQQQKTLLLAAGRDADDPAIVNYERRLQSGNAFGLLAHPNVTASCMAMGAVATIGILAAAVVAGPRSSSRLGSVLAGGTAIAALLAVGIALTGSNGAIGAAAVGVVVLVGAGMLVSRASVGPAALMLACAAAYAGVIVAIAVLGATRGTLPGASLAFRWEYWIAALHAMPDVGLVGLGRENFGPAYLLHKAMHATEEVRNPHSLWIALWVELGPVGLLAGAALLAAAIAATIPRATTDVAGSVEPARPSAGRSGGMSGTTGPEGPTGMPRIAVILVPVAVLLVQGACSGTPLQAPFPHVTFLWLCEVAFAWIVVYGGALFALQWAKPPALWAVAGCFGAGACALVHNLIDYSLLTPAGIAMFVGITAAGARIGRPASDPIRPAAATRITAAAIGVAACGCYAMAVLIPTTASEAHFDRALAAARGARSPEQFSRAADVGHAAATADRWDSSVPRSLGHMFAQAAQSPGIPPRWRRQWLDQARQFASIAEARNPWSTPNARLTARVAEQGALEMEWADQLEDASRERSRACLAWTRVTELYPTSPRDHLAAAGAYWIAWRLDGAEEAGLRCLAHLDRCLAIDETRPADNASKLRRRERSEIHAISGEVRCRAIAPPVLGLQGGHTR